MLGKFVPAFSSGTVSSNHAIYIESIKSSSASLESCHLTAVHLMERSYDSACHLAHIQHAQKKTPDISSCTWTIKNKILLLQDLYIAGKTIAMSRFWQSKAWRTKPTVRETICLQLHVSSSPDSKTKASFLTTYSAKEWCT